MPGILSSSVIFTYPFLTGSADSNPATIHKLSTLTGIAFYPDHGEDMDTLIHSADRAMYDAWNSGRNRFTIIAISNSTL